MPTYLSAELAQRVVERLEPSLESNLNVMDATGLIIASGDASRVGQFHPGAREAAERGEPVAVLAETARDGERPGINVPLRHEDRIIGVVGLTGEPDEVRPIAAVLVLTIALLLDRELELGQQARRDAQDRELLSRLVFGTSARLAVASLERRHADIPAPWAMHVVLPGAADGAGFDPRTVTALRAGVGSGPAVVAVLRGSMWIFSSAPVGPVISRRLEASAALRDRIGGDATLISSIRCADPAALMHETAQLARFAARPSLLPETEATLDTAALGLETAAAALPPETADALRGHLAGLRAVDLETLAHFLASGSVADAAARGYAHRNTVVQRLARVRRVSGLDPRAPGDASTLRLALVLQREAEVLARAGAHRVHAALIDGDGSPER